MLPLAQPVKYSKMSNNDGIQHSDESDGENENDGSSLSEIDGEMIRDEDYTEDVINPMNPWTQDRESRKETDFLNDSHSMIDSNDKNKNKRRNMKKSKNRNQSPIMLRDLNEEDFEDQLHPAGYEPPNHCLTFFQRLVWFCIFIVGLLFGIFITILVIQNNYDKNGFLSNMFRSHKSSTMQHNGFMDNDDTGLNFQIGNDLTTPPTTRLQKFHNEHHYTAPPTKKPFIVIKDTDNNNDNDNNKNINTNHVSTNPTNKPTSGPSVSLINDDKSSSPTQSPIKTQTKAPSISPTVTQIGQANDDNKDQSNEIDMPTVNPTKPTKPPTTARPSNNPTHAPTKPPTKEAYIVKYHENENSNEEECSLLMNSDTQCTMDNFDTLATKILPLPYDRPVHASIYCIQNECDHSPQFHNHKIISSESSDGEEFMLDVSHSIDTQCYDSNEKIFDNNDGGIRISHLNYENNENWAYCMRIINDNGLNDESFVYPILHIDFLLDNLDLEVGFDNLFLTFQQDYVFDDYVYVWTGNDITIHSYKHDSKLQANETDGVYLTEQIFWNTKTHHQSFTEICLNFQSDDSVTGKGFEGIFKIRYEMGIWTKWQDCTNTPQFGLGDDRCGIGIRKRTQYCPRFMPNANGNGNDNNELVDVNQLWDLKLKQDLIDNVATELEANPKLKNSKYKNFNVSLTSDDESLMGIDAILIDNSTHVCMDQYILDPPEFCIVDFCTNIDNFNDYAGRWASGKRWQGINQTTGLPISGEMQLKYHFNGRTRIDPSRSEFANPFALYPNINTTKIDVDFIKERLKFYQKEILQRYQGDTMAENLYQAWRMDYGYQRKKLGMRLLASLLLGKKFTYVATGSSNTAGHDNLWMSSYPMQLQSYMQNVWNLIGLRGSSFRVRDAAIGGHVSTIKLGPCINAIIDNHDHHIDFVTWESMMNDNSGISPFWEEIWLRNVLLNSETISNKMKMNENGLTNTHYRKYEQLFIGGVATGAGPSAMSLHGRVFFNSFMAKYYDYAGVVNVWGGYPCKLEGVPKNVSCCKQEYKTCLVPNARWHPSTHRHRVIAEVYAYAFLNATLERLIELENDIREIISNTDNRPNYKLACLLEDGNEYFENKFKNEKNDEKSGTPAPTFVDIDFVGKYSEYNSQFPRPFPAPKTVDSTFVNRSMWCINSFFPTPDHSKLHHFLIDSQGFSNVDIQDTPVSPMIFRNGGRMSIDHKAQWKAEIDGFGSYMELWVKVLTRYIMIPYSLGASRTNAAEYYSRFKMEVDGKRYDCINRGYDANYNVPDSISQFWDIEGKVSCLLDVGKAGKYKLKLTYEKQSQDDETLVVLIDMIVGL